MPHILIIGDEDDPHVTSVCKYLKNKKADYFILNPLHGQINTLTYAFDPLEILISYKENSISYSDITAVWWRFKPLLTNYPKDIGEFETQNFIRREWQLTLEPLKHYLKDCFWINRRESDSLVRNKPYQLDLAVQHGFKIPKGIISNNYPSIAEITDGFEKFLYKPLSYFIIPPDRVLYSSMMTAKELAVKKKNIELAPCIFQEYIEKDFEVRITIVGTTVFPVKINSQKHHKTKFDWRKDQQKLEYETLDLSPEFTSQLLKLHDTFGIFYGAYDFIVSPDGTYHFLEVNPAGQWLWLERAVDLNISERIADALINEK